MGVTASSLWLACWVSPTIRCKAQTPLLRFVVDLLYNKLYNKSKLMEFGPRLNFGLYELQTTQYGTYVLNITNSLYSQVKRCVYRT